MCKVMLYLSAENGVATKRIREPNDAHTLGIINVHRILQMYGSNSMYNCVYVIRECSYGELHDQETQ